MVYFDYDKNKMNNNYQKLLTLYENAEGKNKYEIYGEIKKLLSYTQNKRINIPEPEGYKDYKELRRVELSELLSKYNALTKILAECWYYSIINASGSHDYSYRTNYLTKDEFKKKILLFFDNYFKGDKPVAEELFNNNKLRLKRNIFIDDYKSDAMYFAYLEDYYIRIISGQKLNEELILDLVHEIGHIITYKNCNKIIRDNLFDEVLSTLYEFKYLEEMKKGNNLNLEIVHYFKKIGQIQKLYPYITENNDMNRVNYAYLDLIQKLYAHIIYLTLYERGREEYMRAIKLFKENASLEPLEQLSKVGISEDDLIRTSSNARKILKK